MSGCSCLPAPLNGKAQAVRHRAPAMSSLFWPEVKAQAAAGLIVLAVGSTLAGVGYLIYTVPSRLDQVLSNQTEIKGRMVQMEDLGRDLERRVIKLETARGI